DIDELIANTQEGVYALSWKSHSIDDKRMNFQFSTQIGWKIEHGELTQPLKNVSYNASTPEFWGSCDMITKASLPTAQSGSNCAKGIPMQLIWISHGGGWARFNDVNVFAG
ncbi:MAG: metallopeptidase TldD-related protein, partial [Candidatus Hodarchaeales archaeon]